MFTLLNYVQKLSDGKCWKICGQNSTDFGSNVFLEKLCSELI